MAAFSGEPLVGEIVGLRTFRVDDAGRLLPLYSGGTWYDGVNTARCDPPTGDVRRFAHRVPDPACECGFYAYGTVAAASRARQARYVRAVVSLWGDVVAGTQGVRAEHARIEAIWLHPDAPASLRSRVAGRYPSARRYADVETMLACHPLTELDCYAPPAPRLPARRAGQALLLALVLVLGLLPHDTLSTPGLWQVWLVAVAGTAVASGWLLVGARGIGHCAAAVVGFGLCAWLLAPLFGLFGWLLRLPLLRAMLVAAAGAALTLRPHHFPVVRERGPVAVGG